MASRTPEEIQRDTLFMDIRSNLEDIAHSLRIISGRSERVEIHKKETYAEKYFAPSMVPSKKTTAD